MTKGQRTASGDRELPDAVGRHDAIEYHRQSVAVATCFNTANKECRKLHKVIVLDIPPLCPNCGNALFYERVSKRAYENGVLGKRRLDGHRPTHSFYEKQILEAELAERAGQA